MPYLPWHFGILSRMGTSVRAVLTLLTSIGAALFARIFVLRYSGPQAWGRLPSSSRLLDLTSFFLLAHQLIFYKLGDRYLLVLLPFALIVLGRHLGNWLNRFRVATAIACVAMLAVSAVRTRGELARAEAMWTAAELVRCSGVEPSNIYGYWTWMCYYAFEEYSTDTAHRELYSVSDFWDRWLPERRERAQFLVTESPKPPVGEKWELAMKTHYELMPFWEKPVYVFRRTSRSH